jgi:hypothetical protein
VAEPLAGTASTLRRWFLVEHGGPWGHDLRDARLPDGVGAALRDVERRARCRVLLIRRPSREPSSGTTCFAVDTADGWIGRAVVDDVSAAPGLDPLDRDAFALPVEGPVAVVCTHGRRDTCCAERGRPLAAALAAADPLAVWESSHMGGDRFAANLLVFPLGLMFGHVEPERGPAVLAACSEGRIVLDRFRGRTSDPMAVQAADAAARDRLGLERVADVTPLAYDRDGARATVRLAVPGGEALVQLERHELPPMRLTCSSTREESPAVWSAVSVALPAPGAGGGR